jgi:hypothetical protein
MYNSQPGMYKPEGYVQTTHLYKRNVQSVSKEINIQSTKGLYFDQQKHEYFVDQTRLPSVSEIISSTKEKTDYSMVPEHVLKRAAEIGHEVHRVVELHIKDGGPLKTEHSGAAKYMPAVRAFFRCGVLEPVHSEMKLYHPEYMYAGTVDVVGLVNGKPAIVDFKTTNVLNKGSVALQLAAYAELVGFYDRAENPDRVFGRYAVHLDRAGGFKLHRFSDPLDLSDFLHALDKWYAAQ